MSTDEGVWEGSEDACFGCVIWDVKRREDRWYWLGWIVFIYWYYNIFIFVWILSFLFHQFVEKARFFNSVWNTMWIANNLC